MPHQDARDSATNLQSLKAVLELLIPHEANSFIRHGNAKIKPGVLAAVAIACWGWTSDGTLDQRVEKAWTLVSRAFRVRRTATRQGVMKALATCGNELVESITSHLATQLPQFKGHWAKNGKVNLAVDGSKFAAPRTAANQECFAANARKSRSKKYDRPASRSKAQTVQVTVLWHLGTGLPFRWHVNSSTGSERINLKEMVESLPRNVRLIGDAEYVGYPLWSTIIQARKSFLFRVGSNVTLLKNLGHLQSRDGYMYFWPQRSMRRGHPPIILRLFKLNTGKKAIYLVTNELDLTVKQAGELYRQRWQVEIFFRTVKQSCQRAKLRCGVPANVITEMNWTLIGIWAALHHGNNKLLENGHSHKLISPIKVVRAFDHAVIAVALYSTNAKSLNELLAEALRHDESARKSSKKSRNYPRKKKKPPAGKPIIKAPTKEQKQRAKQFFN